MTKQVDPKQLPRIAVGITGASGSVYAQHLLKRLRAAPVETHLTWTRLGGEVWQHEIGTTLPAIGADDSQTSQGNSRLVVHGCDELIAPPGWGQEQFAAYVVVPCSMHTLSAVATGLADNLVTRFCQVALKERRCLVMVPRESPIHAVHLRHMATLSEMGANMVPACPGFYNHPQTIDDLVEGVVERVWQMLSAAIAHRVLSAEI